MSTLQVTFSTESSWIGRGAGVANACADGSVLPCGRLWYRLARVGRALDILYMFVEKAHRRTGVASALFRSVLRHHRGVRRVSTASCTKLSRPWLLKHGFHRNQDGDWNLEVARHKQPTERKRRV